MTEQDSTSKKKEFNIQLSSSSEMKDNLKRLIIEVESRIVATRGWAGEGEGSIGRCWSMGTKLQLQRVSSGEQQCNVYFTIARREVFECCHHNEIINV